MYPKVFADYMADRAHFGDVSVLPTPAFFYGLRAGRGDHHRPRARQDLIIRYVATSDVHDDGTRTVFFELNGQPRSVKVPDRSQVAKRPPRRKAEADTRTRSARRCRARSRRSTCIAGHEVARGDVLLTIEAMKMETSVRAERDGVVAEVVARPGQQVDAKDLLVVLAEAHIPARPTRGNRPRRRPETESSKRNTDREGNMNTFVKSLLVGTVIAFGVAAVSSAAAATDPVVGTWTLNLSKSVSVRGRRRSRRPGSTPLRRTASIHGHRHQRRRLGDFAEVDLQVRRQGLRHQWRRGL